MVARSAPSAALVVTFEREGEPPARIEVPNGQKALLRATALLIAYRELRPGDRLTVTAAE